MLGEESAMSEQEQRREQRVQHQPAQAPQGYLDQGVKEHDPKDHGVGADLPALVSV